MRPEHGSERTGSGDGQPSPHREYDRISDALIRRRFEFEERQRLQGTLEELRASTSFRLGSVLIALLHRPGKVFGLPRELIRIWRAHGAGKSSPGCSTAVNGNWRSDAELRVPTEPELVMWSKGRTGWPSSTEDLRIAAVVDEFTLLTLAPDCNMHLMAPEDPGQQLDAFRPHLLLVESAWNGNHGSWRDALRHDSTALQLLLDCCRRRGIATVFWNKEDPVHFEHFVEVAKLFDHVYTTDENMLERYAREGCASVGLLRFFCQPALHNPLRDADQPREAAACCFGSWYAQYPERGKALDEIIGLFDSNATIHIYDRNYGRNAPEFTYPERYLDMVRPAVPYAEVPPLMKRYAVGININTVTCSPSMYSRRIHEMTACRTTVVTNFSQGAFSDYGDALIYSDREDAATLVQEALEAGGSHGRSARALDIVMTRHVSRVRLAQLARDILEVDLQERPVLRVVVPLASPAGLQSAVGAFDRVSWPSKVLTIVSEHAGLAGPELARNDVEVHPPGVAAERIVPHGRDERWFFAASDGMLSPEYLSRAMAATSYAGSATVGVPIDQSELDLAKARLRPQTCLFHPDALPATTLGQLSERMARLAEVEGVSIQGEAA